MQGALIGGEPSKAGEGRAIKIPWIKMSSTVCKMRLHQLFLTFFFVFVHKNVTSNRAERGREKFTS